MVRDFTVAKISNSVMSKHDAFMVNCMVMNRNGKTVVTNRPPINLLIDASEHSVTGTGRGSFYWEDNSTLYTVNGGTVYRWSGTTATSVGSLTANARSRVYFGQVGTRLILVDPQNNDAWTIQTDHTLAKITDADFPSTLAHGLAILNKSAYVLDESGVIYGSDPGDATSWGALNFIEAERSPDGGVFICSTHDQVVVVGDNTIEIFFDNGNPSGSPLSRREDIAYRTGSWSNAEVSFAQEGDFVFFVAQTGEGGISAFLLHGLDLMKISTEHVDFYLRVALGLDTGYSYDFLGSVLVNDGHIFYILTTAQVSSSTAYGTELKIVYDMTANIWCEWSSSMGVSMPIQYRNINYSTYSGYGITTAGDVVTMGYMYGQKPVDMAIDDSALSDTVISCNIFTGQEDHGMGNYKFCNSAQLIMEQVPNTYSNSITLYHVDEDNSASYSTGRALDPATRSKLTRMGRYISRNWHVLFKHDTDRLYLEALELDIEVGNT